MLSKDTLAKQGCTKHCMSRVRCGPSGRSGIFILMDRCLDCGKFFPLYPERLNYKEKDWIRRWNKRIDTANNQTNFIDSGKDNDAIL